MLGGQAGARVHESGIALWQGDRDAGAHCAPLARFEHDVLGCAQVSPGVAAVSVGGQGDVRVELSDLYPQFFICHIDAL
ncbi:hypothetical protein GCM10009637_19180 [Brevibacterium luteolum]